MRIVVDASVIMAVLLNEVMKPEIIQATKGVLIVSPASLPWEIGNALSANVKRKRISPEQAIQAIQDFQKIDIRLVDIDLERAIRLSCEHNIYAYDAYLLACASGLGLPLFCLDENMIRIATRIGIKTMEV